jgi:hypothetical protein
MEIYFKVKFQTWQTMEDLHGVEDNEVGELLKYSMLL